MDDKDLYWLAGLLEGEGSFQKPPPCEPNRPRITIEMTDEDVIQRVNNLFDLNYYHKIIDEEHENWKPSFRVTFRGKKAAALMRSIYSVMGERRKRQIEIAINEKPDAQLSPTDENWFFWLVGWLEGEGSFIKSPPDKLNKPRIHVVSTDEDVIAHVASLLGTKPMGPYKSSKAEYRSRYFVTLDGKRAIELMKQLQPHMSLRRQAQIEAVIASYHPVGQVRGERHPQSKLNTEQVREIKRRLASGEKLTHLARTYGVDTGLIWQIKAGRIWQHVQ